MHDLGKEKEENLPEEYEIAYSNPTCPHEANILIQRFSYFSGAGALFGLRMSRNEINFLNTNNVSTGLLYAII